jgi:hypothetical protein
MASFNDTPLSCENDKISTVFDFLMDGDESACMIIVGAGGSGKSLATNAAIKKFVKLQMIEQLQQSLLIDESELSDQSDDEYSDVNIYVWNSGEMPQLMHYADRSNTSKWIVCRDSACDTLSRGLIEEWNNKCRVVYFENIV